MKILFIKFQIIILWLHNDTHWTVYFDMNDMDNDIVGVDLNLILQLQQQIQLWTKVIALTILCIVARGLNMLRLLSQTISNIRECLPQNSVVSRS